MANRQSEWKGLLESINRPLGFYSLALLIIESFLAIVYVFGNVEASVKIVVFYTGVVLFVLVFSVVSIMVWCRPDHLIFSEFGSLVSAGKASFGTNSVEVSLEEEMKGEPSNEEVN